MDKNEVGMLIESFKQYRDLLVPVQKNLNDFVGTYDIMRENINKLNNAFEGDVKGKMEEIFRQMSEQASKAANLSARIDQLTDTTSRYASGVSSLVSVFNKIEERLKSVSSLEKRAEEQIARLDAAIEEKSKSYNIKDLQKSLDIYNQDVRKVSEFINKNVAESLIGSQKQLDEMKKGLESIIKSRGDETSTMETLLESYKTSNEFLRRITEKQDVNEAYLFDILDKWADARRIKTKR